MRKKRIIVFNFLIITFLLVGAEAYFYNQNIKKIAPYPEEHYSVTKKNFSIENLKESMRKPFGTNKNYKKRPILIYGCSFAYGDKLPKEETFGSLLSEKSKRPVYNFAMPARGLQHALYLLENDKKVTPEPEYIFYVFISDHARRIYINCNRIDDHKYLYYHLKNGKLVLQNNYYDISERFFILKELKNALYFILKKVFEENIYQDVKNYFITIKDTAKEKYPNAKFVIINYNIDNTTILTIPRQKELEQNGIEIISLRNEIKDNTNKDLKADEFRISTDIDFYQHPNGKAWNVVTDYLCKKYNL